MNMSRNVEERRRDRKRLVLAYALLIAVAILFLGKVIWFPVAFMIVAGRSMEPTYSVGDLVIGVATYLRGFNVGDVVVWCRDFWRTACVVHRAVNISSSYIVTRGDANPGPDPPVPVSSVYYVIVAHIPWFIWIPLLATIIILVGYLSYRESGKRVNVFPGLVVVSLVATYMAINAGILGFTYIDNSPPFYYTPRVDLLSASLDLYKSIYRIVLNLSEFSLVDASCVVGGSLGVNTTRFVNGSTAIIDVHIPKNFYQFLWNRTSAKGVGYLPSPPASVMESFPIDCVFRLDRGELRGSYVAVFNWIEPIVKSFNDTLVIVNDNPVPIGVRVELFSHARQAIVFSREYRVEPLSQLVIEFSRFVNERGVYTARVYYNFLGVVRGQGAEIRIP
ncbi:MAG: signal peptidase I [Ignisphaera sp.]|nr:signal peptidase I [Ignisphaera sp.]